MIRLRREQFDWVTCVVGATTAHRMVKSFSLQPPQGEEARRSIHPSRPLPQTPPVHHPHTPAGILRLSEGSGAGRYQPRELKSSFCLERPTEDLCLPALSANHKLYLATRNTGEHVKGGEKNRQDQRPEMKSRNTYSSFSCHINLHTFYIVD